MAAKPKKTTQKKTGRQDGLRERQVNQSLRSISAAFFIMITAIFPLYITGTRYVGFVQAKANFFYIITSIAAVLTLFALLFLPRPFRLRDYFTKDEPGRPPSVAEWGLLAFIWLTFLSAVFSRWQHIVWSGYQGRHEGFWTILCYGVTFFIIARFFQPKRLHFLLFAGGAVLVSLYAILQFCGWDIFEFFPYTMARFLDADGNPTRGPLSITHRTTLGNTNIVAAYCSLVIPLFAALFAEERTKYGWFYLAASVMSFALLLITRGDGGKVGVLGGMVLLIPFWISNRERLGKIFIALSGWSVVYMAYNLYLDALKRNPELHLIPFRDRRFLQGFTPVNPVLLILLILIPLTAGLFLTFLLKKWPEPRRMKIAGFAFLTLAAVGGVLFIEIIGARIVGQPRNIFWQAREILHGRMQDSFGTNRGWVWIRGLSVIPEHPILGTGPDTFYHALGDTLQHEAFRRYNIVFDKAHNMYLQIAVCMGIPALLAFLTFWGGLFAGFIKKALSRPFLLACGAGALSYLIQAFFLVDMPVDKPLLWAVFGVMAGEIWRERIGV